MRRPEHGRGRRLCAALLLPALLVGEPGARAHAAADPATLDCAPRIERSAELPAPRHAVGLLWEVRGPNGAVGHLFGTIHLALPEVTTLSPQVRATLEASSRFGMEVLFDAAALEGVADAMRAAPGGGLAHDAGPALYARTLALLARYGIDEATAAGLATWAAWTTLSLPPKQTAAPLDLELMLRARAAGKELFGVETLAEQTALFTALPAAYQVALLRETVCHWDELQREMGSLVEAWVAGDLARIYREAMRYDSPVQRRLLDSLLHARNARMAERLAPRFAVPGAFVAVGALHLPGPGGLLERLAAAGYALRAIDR